MWIDANRVLVPAEVDARHLLRNQELARYAVKHGIEWPAPSTTGTFMPD